MGGAGLILGYGFTSMTTSGGPAFLGNTRDGWASESAGIYGYFASQINKGITNLGIAELISKSINASYHGHYLSYSHNLVGCPETRIWTTTPTVFSSATVTDNGSTIIVNAGASGCNITVCSGNNGAQYYLPTNNVSSYTFSTTVRPLYITITKPNYLPYTVITGGTLTSNEQWFERMVVLGNVTINGGATLTVSPGATITFANGASLTAIGTFNANGTSSNMITFDRSGSSGNWGGIVFNSSSSGSLSYCNIQNATTGVTCNGYLPSIAHCTIIYNSTHGINVSNCVSSSNAILNNTIALNSTSGIHENNSAFLCQGNNISYNGYSGIWCQYGFVTSPVLSGNIIIHNGYGLNCYQSSPYLATNVTIGHQNMPGPGNNVIEYNTTYGISAAYGSDIWLGDVSVGGSGQNSIAYNTTWGLYAVNDHFIFAENNWWNGPPSISKDNNTIVYIRSYLSTDPNSSMSGNSIIASSASFNHDMLQKSSVIGKNLSVVQSADSTLSGENELSQIMQLEFQGHYDQVILQYKQIFSREQNTNIGRYALRKLKECFTQLNEKDQFDAYLNASVKPTTKVKNELNALLIEFDNETLFENKNYDAMVKNLTGIIKDFKGNEGVYKHTLYDLGFLYQNSLNDKVNAAKYFSRLETEFPKDMLVTMAHYQLGKDAGVSINPSPSINNNNENATDTTQAQNVQENKLLTVYPNPFNPSTVIGYQLKSISNVTLKVYDMLGREVVTLVEGIKEAGSYTATFHGDKLASGIYFARFIATPQNGNQPFIKTMKMLMMK